MKKSFLIILFFSLWTNCYGMQSPGQIQPGVTQPVPFISNFGSGRFDQIKRVTPVETLPDEEEKPQPATPKPTPVATGFGMGRFDQIKRVTPVETLPDEEEQPQPDAPKSIPSVPSSAKRLPDQAQLYTPQPPIIFGFRPQQQEPEIFQTIRYGLFDRAKQIISEKGFDPNIKDKDGNTILHFLASLDFNNIDESIIKKDQELIVLLIQKGADISIKNKYGNTAIILANLDSKKGKIFEDTYIKAGKQKASLTEYKDYKCKRVAIFINENPQNNPDAVFTDFLQNIIQQACPIITTRPILRLFIKNPYFDNLKTNWSIYSKNGTGEDIFYLLIPKIAEYLGLQKLGFNSNLRLCNFNTSANINQNPIDFNQTNDFFETEIITKIDPVSNKEIKETINKSFFDTNSGPWNIYLIGHGSTKTHIAGMPTNFFEQFLNFLSKILITNFLFYKTCFGGGINLVTPYINKNINFTIAQQAATENTTSGLSIFNTAIDTTTGLPTGIPAYNQFSPSFNLINFFQKAEDFFESNFNSANQSIGKIEPFKFLNDLFKSIISENLTSNEPLIRFPGTDFFQAHEFSDKIEIFTQTQMKAKALEQTQINIPDNKEILLLYPPIIPVSIKLPSNDNFKIISMNPEYALHFFKELDGDNFESYEKSLSSPFDAIQGNKIFIIKNWKFNNGYEFSDIVIYKASLYPHSAIYYSFKISKTPKTEDLGKILYLDKNTKNDRLFTEESYKNYIKKLLDNYISYNPLLKDSRGNLLAPWQEEPSILAAFAKQELGIEEPATEELAAKIEEAKTRFFYNEELVSKFKKVLGRKSHQANANINRAPEEKVTFSKKISLD